LSKIFGSGSDSDTIEIFRSGSDYQISISAQHWYNSSSIFVYSDFVSLEQEWRE